MLQHTLNKIVISNPTICPTYIRVRAVVWECGEGQIDTQTHRRPWPMHISPRLRLTRNVRTAWVLS